MCGIVGWLDFKRDLVGEAQLLNDMCETLRCRGPDDGGAWVGGVIALGHRRLAVIDLEGGKQPMVAEIGQNSVAVTFCGEIYNFRELRAELKRLGKEFRTDSDTEVLLQSYLCWGLDALDRMTGMYAFGIWDGRTRSLHLVRDRLGVKPLYVFETATGVVFGSEPKSLFASGQVEARVGREEFCEILDMVATPGTAPYIGMTQVRPGEVQTYTAAGRRARLYWKLEAREHPHDLPKTILHTRDLLEAAVRGQMVADVPLCALLSGGLDSSSITAIAAAERPDDRLRTVALKFSEDESFSKDAVRGSPDAPFALALAAHVGTDHNEVLVHEDMLLNDEVRSAVLCAVDAPPAFWGDMWPSLLLMFREVRRHATVALSGEAADELFGGYRWFHNPQAVAADTFPWLTSGSARYFGGSSLLSPALLAKLDIEDYRHERYAEAVLQCPQLPGEDDDEARMRQILFLNQTRFVQTLLDRKDRMSMATSLEVRVPFCDHHLVEYVFNVPWAMKAFDGREKSLLRAAVKDLLPSSILDRQKTPYPAIQNSTYEASLKMRLDALLQDRGNPVHALLDREKVEQAVRRPVGRVSQPYNRGGMEMALWLSDWLARYRVDLAI